MLDQQVSDPKIGEVVSVLGYRFRWTKDHKTAAQLAPLLNNYDKLADDVLERLDQIYDETLDREAKEGKAVPAKRDNIELIKAHLDQHPVVAEFWKEVNTVPEWVDWDQIARGQDVFYRYVWSILIGFFFHAFFGINGSSRRASEILARTGGHSARNLMRRFFETFQMILQVTKSIKSVKPGGEGHITAIKVRLLHAAVRRRLMKLARSNPSYFNLKNLGIPINHLDAIQGGFEFHFNQLHLNLPKFGIYVKAQEEKDYLALWRWIQFVMGVLHEHMAKPATSLAMMESVFLEATQPSRSSINLVASGISGLEGAAPIFGSREYFEAGVRWFMGHEHSDAIGIGRPSSYYTALVFGQMWICVLEIYITRSSRYLDRKKIKAYRDLLWKLTIYSNVGLKGKKHDFNFKYVPSADHDVMEGGPSSEQATGGIHVERVGLVGLVLAGLCLAMFAALVRVAFGFSVYVLRATRVF